MGLRLRISFVSASIWRPALALPRQNRQSGATMVTATTPAERLLARVARGDRMAFSDLYDRYASAVYGACLRVLREPQAAEDAAQEAFAAIWRHAGAFDAARGAAGAWLGARGPH